MKVSSCCCFAAAAVAVLATTSASSQSQLRGLSPIPAPSSGFNASGFNADKYLKWKHDMGYKPRVRTPCGTRVSGGDGWQNAAPSSMYNFVAASQPCSFTPWARARASPRAHMDAYGCIHLCYFACVRKERRGRAMWEKRREEGGPFISFIHSFVFSFREKETLV